MGNQYPFWSYRGSSTTSCIVCSVFHTYSQHCRKKSKNLFLQILNSKVLDAKIKPSGFPQEFLRVGQTSLLIIPYGSAFIEEAVGISGGASFKGIVSRESADVYGFLGSVSDGNKIVSFRIQFASGVPAVRTSYVYAPSNIK